MSPARLKQIRKPYRGHNAIRLNTAGVRNHAADILNDTGYVLEKVNGYRNWMHVTDLTGITRLVYFWRGIDLHNLERLLQPENINDCQRIKPEGGFF